MSHRDLSEILLNFERPPSRLVSLVPSYTDSLFTLGMGKAVVGITDYCQVTASEEARLVRVGGTKDSRIEDILKLGPELVLANFEENTQQVVEAIEAAGVPVWVSFPHSIDETIEFLWGLVDLFRSQPASFTVKVIDTEVEWTRLAAEELRKTPYFCPIWQGEDNAGLGWWMTCNNETYSASLLNTMGGVNIFGNRKRRYPLEADLGRIDAESDGNRDTRYPCVTSQEIIAGKPEIVFLPDEPFNFRDENTTHLMDVLQNTPAGRNQKIYFVDGKLITWCGTKLASAISELSPLFAQG